MIQKFNDTDGVTVFDYDEKIKEQVESGVICLTFTILGSKTTVPLAAVKLIDGRKIYTMSSIWKSDWTKGGGEYRGRIYEEASQSADEFDLT